MKNTTNAMNQLPKHLPSQQAEAVRPYPRLQDSSHSFQWSC